MTKSKEKKAREYEKTRNILTLVNLLLTFIFLICVFAIGKNGGLSAWFVRWIEGWSPSVWVTVGAYGLGGLILSTSLFLPLKFYSGYILEHRYKLSVETVGGWFKDLFKSLGIEIVITLLMIEVVYALMRGTAQHWWLWAAACWILFAVVMSNLFPVLILPLFYKLTPVKNKKLVTKLVKMAKKVGAKILGVFEMDMSRKTKKANAMLTGLGNTKRIIFGDTLLKNFSEREIEVVLAHELGHFYHKHMWKLILMSTVATFAGLFLAHLSLTYFIEVIGFRGLDDVANFPLLLLVLSLFFLITMPLSNSFSRFCERQSDQFALDQTKDAPSFISAMEKLAEQNLANKKPNPFIEFCLYSHPSISKRIQMAKNFRKK